MTQHATAEPYCEPELPLRNTAHRGLLHMLISEMKAGAQMDMLPAGTRIWLVAGIAEAMCMAHARRKIHGVHARFPTDITTEALKRIGELYAIEAAIRGSPADARRPVRKARTVPLMQSLYDWIRKQVKVLSRHSDTAKAFSYLLNSGMR